MTGSDNIAIEKVEAAVASAASTSSINTNQAIVHLYAYDENNLVTKNITDDFSVINDYLGKIKVVWVDVLGKLTDEKMHALFAALQLDAIEASSVDASAPLAANLTYYPMGILKISHLLFYGDNFSEQFISLFLGQNFLLTLHEAPCGAINKAVSRLADRRRAIRYGAADYTMYYILINIVNAYLQVVRRYGDGIDELEDALVIDPNAFAMTVFFSLRKRLTIIKRKLWLQRDVLSQITLLSDHEKAKHIIDQDTLGGYQNCYNRASEVLDLLDTHIDHCRGLLDIYFSSNSNQMNKIMKTLTIFSAIFLPLSFLAGLWGMNFDYNASPWNMPELKFYYGYPMALSIMFTIAIGLLVVFTCVGWLSFKRSRAAKAAKATVNF